MMPEMMHVMLKHVTTTKVNVAARVNAKMIWIIMAHVTGSV